MSMALVFQFQPNPIAPYFFLGLLGLFALWVILEAYLAIRDVNRAFKKVDYEIVVEKGEAFVEFFVMLNGRKHVIDRKRAPWAKQKNT